MQKFSFLLNNQIKDLVLRNKNKKIIFVKDKIGKNLIIKKAQKNIGRKRTDKDLKINLVQKKIKMH
jgi:hypothetical protein